MKHRAHPDFWYHYRRLPRSIRGVADKNFELLKANPRHGSIRLKKVAADIYSARIGLDHRALAFDRGTHLIWFCVHDVVQRSLEGQIACIQVEAVRQAISAVAPVPGLTLIIYGVRISMSGMAPTSVVRQAECILF